MGVSAEPWSQRLPTPPPSLLTQSQPQGALPTVPDRVPPTSPATCFLLAPGLPIPDLCPQAQRARASQAALSLAQACLPLAALPARPLSQAICTSCPPSSFRPVLEASLSGWQVQGQRYPALMGRECWKVM